MPKPAPVRAKCWSLPDLPENVPFWMMILGFLLVLGPLVTIHELGHYLVGRWFGVKAEAFSIGFGREIAGRTDKRGTRWKLSLLPLGGYVQFAGDMNPAGQPSEAWLALPEEERAKTFQSKALWKRSLIVLAGPVTNLAFAIIVFAGFFMAIGRPEAAPIVGTFAEESTAQVAGLRVGRPDPVDRRRPHRRLLRYPAEDRDASGQADRDRGRPRGQGAHPAGDASAKPP